MTLVLVTKEALKELLAEAWGNERCYATHLEPGDAVLTIAVEAGLQIPGPVAPGKLPPLPPKHRFTNGADHMVTAATYRTAADPRLRCEADAKVVYTSMEKAERAAQHISDQREAMKAYQGTCGHYHVARSKK